MSGFSSVTGDESIIYGDNLSFDGTKRGGKLTANGQLFIGAGSTPHVRKGVIKSNGGTVIVTYDAPDINLEAAGGGGVTLTGDAGSPITGSSLTVFANKATRHSGASVGFTNGTTTSTLNLTDSLSNTLLGLDAGGTSMSGLGNNTGVGGTCLTALTTGANNTAIGNNALALLQTGDANVALGRSSLNSVVSGQLNTAVGEGSAAAYLGDGIVAVGDSSLKLTTGTGNTSVGYLAGRDITTGQNNCIMGYIALINGSTATNCTAIGYQALTNASGNSNIAIGSLAGSNYGASETGNILIGNTGTAAESNVTRIGTSQTTCYVAGVSGVTVANQNLVTINTSTGQMGSIANTIPAQPNATLNFYDDFLYSGATADFTAAATRYGEWTAAQAGTTKSITPQSLVVAGRPGVLTLSLTSTNAICNVGMIGNNNGNIKMSTNGVVTATWYFNINALSDGTNTYTLLFGLSSTQSPGAGDTVHFSYTHGTNSGQWRCNTTLGGSGTVRSSTTAVAAGYQVAQIVWTPGVQAEFFTGTTLANLTSIVTPIASTLPTGLCAPVFQVSKTLGAGTNLFDLDLFTLTQTFTTAR